MSPVDASLAGAACREVLHYIFDVSHREDASQVRTGNSPQVMATLQPGHRDPETHGRP